MQSVTISHKKARHKASMHVNSDLSIIVKYMPRQPFGLQNALLVCNGIKTLYPGPSRPISTRNPKRPLN